MSSFRVKNVVKNVQKLLEDACATRSKQFHDAVILTQRDMCAKVKKTAEIIEILEKFPDKK